VKLGLRFDNEQAGPPAVRQAYCVRSGPPFIAVGGLDRDVARLSQDGMEEGVEVLLRLEDEQTGHRCSSQATVELSSRFFSRLS